MLRGSAFLPFHALVKPSAEEMHPADKSCGGTHTHTPPGEIVSIQIALSLTSRSVHRALSEGRRQ